MLRSNAGCRRPRATRRASAIRYAAESLERRLLLHKTGTEVGFGPVHQYLTEQAFKYYDNQFANSELAQFIGQTNDAAHRYETNGRDNDLIEGAFDEDELGENPWDEANYYFDAPFDRHFWAHDGNFMRVYDDGLLGYDSAPNRALKYLTGGFGWDGSYDTDWEDGYGVKGEGIQALYSTGRAFAYYYLGHVAHLLEDMTVPAHAHADEHGLADDSYEDFVATGGRYLNWAYPPATRGGPTGDITRPASLYNLFVATAGTADNFDSDDADGQIDKGTRNYWNATEGDFDISAADCWVIGDTLMPLAIRSVAELFRLFYSIVDASSPSVSLVGLSGDEYSPTPQTTSSFSVAVNASDPESGVRTHIFTQKWNGSGWTSAVDWGSSSTLTLADGKYKIYATAENGAGATANSAAGYVLVNTAPDTTNPTASLWYPSATVQQSEVNATPKYIEIAFSDAGGSGVNATSITDTGAEFTLSGTAASGVTVNGAPALVAGTTRYRYSFTGNFGLGTVAVNFAAGSWADYAGNLNAASNQSFTVTSTAPTNTPPTISDLPDTTTQVNTPVTLSFTIGDVETSVNSLQLGAGSANQALVANSNIVFGGSAANRTVTVTPAAGATGTVSISVAVSDAGGLVATDTFNLTVTSAPPAAPEIEIRGNGAVIPDGDTSPAHGDFTDIGSVAPGFSETVSFLICNVGTGPLQLTGSPVIQISGPNASDFSIVMLPATIIAAGDNTPFTVRFSPSATGLRSATISIQNTDSNESPYDFSIQGTGILGQPDMQVWGNGNMIFDAYWVVSTLNDTDFGGVNVSSGSVTHTFTIANAGSGPLSLTGSPKVTISGTNASDFTILTTPSSPLAPYTGTTTFQVKFDPDAVGIRTALVEIQSNDPEHNPYEINVQGAGIITGDPPEIGLFSGSNPLTGMPISKELYNGYPFTFSKVSTQTVSPFAWTFSVTNSGGEPLNLALTVPPGFVLVDPLASAIAPGGFDVFSVRVDNSSAGYKSGTMLIVNNDPDENPYPMDIACNVVNTPLPAVESLTISQTPVTSGTPVTLTAHNVSYPSGTVESVMFYRESNHQPGLQIGGQDILVDWGTKVGADWSKTISTVGLSAGTYTFYARAQDPDGLDSIMGTAAAPVTLTVVDAIPTISVSDVAALEGDNGTKNLVFSATLSQAVDQIVTVQYTTANVTAVAPGDYGAKSGTITFQPGETVELVSVSVVGDFAIEADESFALNLSSPSGGTIADAQGIGTITNDDYAGTLEFSSAVYQFSEGAIATITVRRVGGLAAGVAVAYATSNGTAGTSDYSPSSGSLTFAAGETIKTFTVTSLQDTLTETDETITLTLSSPSGGAALGSPSTAVLTIIDDDINGAPVLRPIGDLSVNEGSPFTFTALADDADGNPLTFTLLNAPTGAAINSSSGSFTWTPGEGQGPATYTLTVCVTDTGNPPLGDQETIQITVGEVNQAPVLAAISDKSANELSAISFTTVGNDADLPANLLTYLLVSAPPGASIDPTTGAFAWTPTEAQGPGTYGIKVRVIDNGSPPLYDDKTFQVAVGEVNQAPVFSSIGNKTVDELATLSFAISAADVDLPANVLTYSLINPPAGASINSVTGIFTWTPTEAQGPASYPVMVRVTDSGSPSSYDEATFQVTVGEVNLAPLLLSPADKTIDELTTLSFRASASDADAPMQVLEYTLDAGAPAGAAIDHSTGQFTWTPDENQGPGVYAITIRVMDNGSPPLDDHTTFQVIVGEVNTAPVVSPIVNKSVDELSPLAFSASADDGDLPAQSLTYSLAGDVPAGAAIDATTGAFTWTPTEAQGPGAYSITIHVTDSGSPPMVDEQTVQVTVKEIHLDAPAAPDLDPASDTGTYSDDNITATGTPTFSGPAGAAPGGAIVELFTPGASLGMTVANADGSWTFAVPAAKALTEGVWTITAAATAGGLVSSASSPLLITVDKTAPAVVWGDASPAANATGWNNSDVSVPFTASDALSGLSPGSSSGTLILSAEGPAITGNVVVTDLAGNTASCTTPVHKIDKTPPTLTWGIPSPAANAAGWNTTSVSVPFTAHDDLSGIPGAPVSPLQISTEGLAVQGSIVLTDAAGNTATFSTAAFKIDKTAPSAAVKAATVTRAVAKKYTFSVTYCDARLVDLATIGNRDVYVTGPRKYLAYGTFVSKALGKAGRAVVVYSIVPPGGSFDPSDNGNYVVNVGRKQVRDVPGNYVAPIKIGGFKVAIPARASAALANLPLMSALPARPGVTWCKTPIRADGEQVWA